MSYFIKQKNSKSDNNSGKVYFESLNSSQRTKLYIQNEMQINCIKKVLVERAEVPEILIDWLIKSVEENVLLNEHLEEISRQ